MEKTILCMSSVYDQMYYLDQRFESLPQAVKDELKIMCVLFTEDVGGIIALEYDLDGKLEFKVSCDEGDLLFDEIGSVLKIKMLQNTKRELLEALELYYTIIFLGHSSTDSDAKEDTTE